MGNLKEPVTVFWNWASSLPVFAQIPIGLGIFALAICLIFLAWLLFLWLAGVSDDLQFQEIRRRVELEAEIERNGSVTAGTRWQYRKALTLKLMFAPAMLIAFVFVVSLFSVLFS